MRLIDADALRKDIEADRDASDMPEVWYEGVEYAIYHIDHAPTIKSERKPGKWIEEPNCMYRCSNCGHHYPSIRGYMTDNFCPHCGADMRGEQE